MTFEIVHQLSEAQIQDLHQLYQTTWWGQGRTLEDVRRMLNHSDLVVGVCHRKTQKLLGFARVLTDYVYRATIWDVMVGESYQGKGLGRTMMNAILEHSSLQTVEAFLLVCLPDMVEFYEKLGFTKDVKQLQLMMRAG